MRKIFVMILFATLTALWIPLHGAAQDEQIAVSIYDTWYEAEVLGLDNFDFDTGWLPAGSPIQVRMIAHAGNTVSVSMDGDALFSWEESAFSVEGAADGGEFTIDAGLDVQAQVRFDIAGYEWDGDLMDPFLYGIFESVVFTPYLLPGHPERPVVIDADLPRETLADVPIGVDLVVASGQLHIEIGGHVHAELVGDSMTLDAFDQGEAVLTEYGGQAPLAADPLLDLEGEATLAASLAIDITFLLYPSVVLTILGTDYTLAEFEVPVDAPPYDETWIFDPVPVAFAAPPPPEAGDDDDAGVQGDAGEGDDRGSSRVSGCGGLAVDGAAGGSTLGIALLLGCRRRRRG